MQISNAVCAKDLYTIYDLVVSCGTQYVWTMLDPSPSFALENKAESSVMVSSRDWSVIC